MAQSKVTTGNIFKKILAEGSDRDPYIKEDKRNKSKADDYPLGGYKSRYGKYEEAYGGGTPLPKGEKAPSEAWLAEHRKMQPRDPDGRFGYNANNGKELKYFVNGKSRGKTVPHYIRHLQLDLIFNKNRVGSTIAYDKKIQYIKSIDMTKEEFIEAAKVAKESFDSFGSFDNTKENRGVKEFERDALNKPHATIETKQGRHSAKEREILQNEDPEKAVEVDSARTVKERKEAQTQKQEQSRIINFIPSESDRQTAKDNPQQFYKDNKKYVDQMVEVLSAKRGRDVHKSEVIAAIASGRIRNSIKQLQKAKRG